MRILVSLLLLAAAATAAAAQAIDRIAIEEYGLYDADRSKMTKTPTAAAGEVAIVTNVKLLEETRKIPARIGVQFGFKYKVIGSAGAHYKMKAVTIVPEPGLRNPRTGNTMIRGEYVIEGTVGETRYKGYTFDEAWELVPGTWRFELWEGDTKLATQSFDIVKP